jgi:hypothetical protein
VIDFIIIPEVDVKIIHETFFFCFSKIIVGRCKQKMLVVFAFPLRNDVSTDRGDGFTIGAVQQKRKIEIPHEPDRIRVEPALFNIHDLRVCYIEQ